MRQTLNFLLYNWLEVETLTQYVRFTDHSLETFDSVLDMCQRLARDKFAPYCRQVDVQEPTFDGEKVCLPEGAYISAKAYAESGMLAAGQDYALVGMQLPYSIELAANSFFSKAGIGLGGAAMLTTGNANLIMAHGTQAQKEAFAHPEFAGRFSGTMCLSEPQAGSSLSDILTRAEPDGQDHASDPLGPRYRLRGNKMWISAGEHELSENIIHLVLAKIPGPDGKLIAGTKGISLFIVPKKLVDAQGALTGERNDVVLAGLNHKLGYRGIPNTLLNFGEGKFQPGGSAGAIGYLVGQPGDGLKCMFHMMNEARIAVGMGATMLAMAGYTASLDYARHRPQGRLVTAAGTGNKDPNQPPVNIIEHADIKRMLLLQKSYSEGALGLALYCARLVDEQHSPEAEVAKEASLLLEILTPIAKSWPSQCGLEANSAAIQIHGGYGYSRDYPVEQYWRDQRLNMIHEGTHGIQALDLLGRKVVMQDGTCFAALRRKILESVDLGIKAQHPDNQRWAKMLARRAARLGKVTEKLWKTGDAAKTLANASLYLEAFGHVVIAWIWLELSLCASRNFEQAQSDFFHGKWQACRYFYLYELPKVDAQLNLLEALDTTSLDMQDAWF